jgi:hypothetical protein
MSTIITSISGLQNLKNLQTFNADWNGLTTLNVSGLTHLTGVDVSDCHTLDNMSSSLTSINLTGCTALEELRIDDSDFSAGYPNLSGLTNLTWLDMDESDISGVVDLSMLSSLNGFDLQDNTGLTSVLLPDTDLNNVSINNAALTQTAVNTILEFLASTGVENGNVNLANGTSAIPTGNGLTAVTTLRSRGWTVSVNQQLPVMGITQTSISSTTATITVSITDEANLGIKAAGVVVGTGPLNLTMDNAIMVGNVNSVVPGIRTISLTGLTAETTYYIRTFIELNSGGDLIYGENANTILTNP